MALWVYSKLILRKTISRRDHLERECFEIISFLFFKIAEREKEREKEFEWLILKTYKRL